jgi:hypothetical protein
MKSNIAHSRETLRSCEPIVNVLHSSSFVKYNSYEKYYCAKSGDFAQRRPLLIGWLPY